MKLNALLSTYIGWSSHVFHCNLIAEIFKNQQGQIGIKKKKKTKAKRTKLTFYQTPHNIGRVARVPILIIKLSIDVFGAG